MSWISVKDRLPKKFQKVLFHWVLKYSSGYPCVSSISMGYLCEQGWDIYLPYHSYALRDDICPVTHWMELPDYPVDEPPVRFVGQVIIDDPLCPHIDEVQDKLNQQATASGINPVVFIPPSTDRATEFAKKFCEENKDLLKRLADR